MRMRVAHKYGAVNNMISAEMRSVGVKIDCSEHRLKP